MSEIKITYLANAGFLITGGGHGVLVDAVFTRAFDPFSAMPPHILEEIGNREGIFRDADLLLVTHRHVDHCDPRHLPQAGGGKMTFLLPGEICDLMPETDQPVIRIERDGVIYRDDGLVITAIQTPHDRAAYYAPVMHVSYLLEYGGATGRRILVMGDAETQPGMFAPWLQGGHVDAVLVNFVEINQKKGRAFLRELNPGTAVLCHLPLPEDDRYHMIRLTGRSLSEYGGELPPCLLCDACGVSLTIPARICTHRPIPRNHSTVPAPR
ncbi:MAG: MBL fold metallo-hydrolase [Eubacterium sp.]|nr:MBL fold metallo-hydrolase [Eubacterium sp.]